MELSSLLKYTDIVSIITAFISLFILLYRIINATSIEKKMETYSQGFIRRLMYCLLWWIVVMIGVGRKVPLEKWTKLDLMNAGVLSLAIFIFVAVMYAECQVISGGFKKKIYFIYKEQRFEFVNEIDSKTLLLKEDDREEGIRYKLLSYDNFDFEDGVFLREDFPSHMERQISDFYEKLLVKRITFPRIRINISFFIMIVGFASALSFALSQLIWTLWIFIPGLIIGTLAFQNVVICFNIVKSGEMELKKCKPDFEPLPGKDDKKILVFYLLASVFLIAGILLNMFLSIYFGSGLIIISSIVLTYVFIEKSVINPGKGFRQENKLKSDSN